MNATPTNTDSLPPTIDLQLTGPTQDSLTAEFIGFKSNQLTIRATRAHAPGSPIQLRARITEKANTVEETLDGRTRTSRRVGTSTDGAPLFEILLRLVSLRRTTRELLEKLPPP